VITWHFFALSYVGYDTWQDEIARTSFSLYFGSNAYWGNANTVDGLYNWF